MDKVLSINDYKAVVKESEQFNRAFKRTTESIACLMRRANKFPTEANEFDHNYGGLMLLILQNYIVQIYFKDYGIDVNPDANDLLEVERIFVRTSYYGCQNKNQMPGGFMHIHKDSYYLSQNICQSEDVFNEISSYAKKVLNPVPLERCNNAECIHMKDPDIYLTIFQVVTLAYSMGQAAGVFHGVNTKRFGSGRFGIPESDFGHFFTVSFQNSHVLIDKYYGDLVITETSKKIHFKDWCDYDVEKGLKSVIDIKKKYDCDILSLDASVGGYCGNSYQVHIDLQNEEAMYTSMEYGFSNKETKIIHLDWIKLENFKRAIRDSNLFNWKKRYSSRKEVMDGTNWFVKVNTDTVEYKFEGSNSCPKDWNEFCDHIEQLIGAEFR